MAARSLTFPVGGLASEQGPVVRAGPVPQPTIVNHHRPLWHHRPYRLLGLGDPVPRPFVRADCDTGCAQLVGEVVQGPDRGELDV